MGLPEVGGPACGTRVSRGTSGLLMIASGSREAATSTWLAARQPQLRPRCSQGKSRPDDARRPAKTEFLARRGFLPSERRRRMSDPQSWSFETRQIHAGTSPDPTTGARALPIYATTAYQFRDSKHAADLFALAE